MLFTSQEYLLFFALVFASYWATSSQRVRVGILLVASFYFYASWNRWLAALIGATSALDFAIGLGLDSSRSPLRRKALLVLSLIANLGLLAYFKYANFFLDSLRQALGALGASASIPALSVILPIGISFYTFEAINYTVDVYRRRLPAERNLAHFLLFITFFPHLVAGPIVRARDFLPQVRRRHRWDWARVQLGAEFLLLGLFKKLAIADRMAAFADPVFANPQQYGTQAVWVAAVAYALQIYCDFSGYSDMAVGSAHLLGYKLSANFRTPYLAANVAEFWRRWHISLSTWLRDYLFIPLGGSRGGRWETSRNLLITMTLGGLWHGASWTFVAWGALHGALLVGHRGFREWAARRPLLGAGLTSLPGRGACVCLTFLAITTGWILFRSTSLESAGAMLGRMVIPREGQGVPMPLAPFWATLVLVGAAHGVAAAGGWRRFAERMPAPVLGFGYAVLLAVGLLLAPQAGKAFVYFQF
jgi:alginate O-acetyltransferase complex protein AlgI